MSRATAILLACVALVTGLAVGAGVGSWITAFIFSGFAVTSNAASAFERIKSLEDIRGSNLPAVTEHLELMLDSDLISLEVLLDDYPGDETALKAIRRAKAYRDRFPRKTVSPEVDAAVQRAFRRVEVAGK